MCTIFARMVSIESHLIDRIKQFPSNQNSIYMQGGLLQSLVSLGSQVDIQNNTNTNCSFLTFNIAAEVR